MNQDLYQPILSEALAMARVLVIVGVSIAVGTVAAIFAIYFVKRLRYILFGFRVYNFVRRYRRSEE